jgi:hypothetical protein
MFGDLGVDFGVSVVGDSRQSDQGHMTSALPFEEWE